MLRIIHAPSFEAAKQHVSENRDHIAVCLAGPGSKIVVGTEENKRFVLRLFSTPFPSYIKNGVEIIEVNDIKPQIAKQIMDDKPLS